LQYELGVEGATLVTPSGRRRDNVYISDGVIAAIGPERKQARSRIAADDLLVMPGMVDTHVHLMEPDVSREDYPTGTAAAVRAGITTIIEHTHGAPVRSVADLAVKRSRLETRSRIDYALAAHAWPGFEDQAEELWREGIAFFKVFTCATHGVPGFDTAQLFNLFQIVSGFDGLALVHCEDERLTSAAHERLMAAGRSDGAIVSEWRSREAEMVAVTTVSLLARLSRARVVIAHVSSPAIVDLVARERAAGARVMCETCPQYLTLTEAEVLDYGPFRKFTPPARARSLRDLDAMWEALAARRIDMISTDHAPSTIAQKKSGSIWDVHFGLPGLDTTLSVLLDAAHRGVISYELIPDVYSRLPAQTYGLWPRKGRLEVGADADLVIVDPEERWTVADSDVVSRAAWTPFAGRTLVGRAVRTISQGRLAAEHGRVIAEPGQGRFIPGAGFPSANRTS
jgi:dihydroorotase (multifunctional complex type)